MKIEINGCSIHYKIRGMGQPILCIHGFPEDHEVMLNCVEPMFEKVDGYQRVYIDLPGMGKSTTSEAIQTADDMLAVVQQFAAQIFKTEKYLLVGQSYGGYLSLGMTVVDPNRVRGLFLLCPCVKADRRTRTLPKRELRQKNNFFINDEEKESFSDFLEMAVLANEDTWSRYKKDILPGLLRADSDFVDTYQTNGYELSFESDFEKFTYDKPTTFLTGKQDDCVGYQDAFQLLHSFSHASFLIIDDAGHNLQIEQPELFQDIFRKWLAKVE